MPEFWLNTQKILVRKLFLAKNVERKMLGLHIMDGFFFAVFTKKRKIDLALISQKLKSAKIRHVQVLLYVLYVTNKIYAQAFYTNWVHF